MTKSTFSDQRRHLSTEFRLCCLFRLRSRKTVVLELKWCDNFLWRENFFQMTNRFPFCITIAHSSEYHSFKNSAGNGVTRLFLAYKYINNDDDLNDFTFYRKARGQLRTKIESGEGTIPVKSSDGIQTWDGVNKSIEFSTHATFYWLK